MELQPRQFFHGSHANLREGDLVRPGAEVGTNNYPYLGKWRNKEVWATDDEEAAWDWASTPRGSGKARQTVYEVAPISEPKKRRKLDTMAGKEYTMPAAKVVRRIDIPPPEKVQYASGNRRLKDRHGAIQGVQGTLPPVAWQNYERNEVEQIKQTYGRLKERRVGIEKAKDYVAKQRAGNRQERLF